MQGLDDVDLKQEPLVPYLESWVATAEAPQALVEAFTELAEGPGPEGALADVRGRARPHRALACLVAWGGSGKGLMGA